METALRPPLEVVRRRRAPEFCIVDRALRPLYAANGDPALDRILARIRDAEDAVGCLVSSLDEHTDEVVALLGTDVIVRVVALRGTIAEHFAVFFETYEERNALAGAASWFALTPREYDVLQLVVQGKSFGAIARHLSIAETTVQAHTRNIGYKMECSGRAEIVATALRLRSHGPADTVPKDSPRPSRTNRPEDP